MVDTEVCEKCRITFATGQRDWQILCVTRECPHDIARAAGERWAKAADKKQLPGIVIGIEPMIAIVKAADA